MSGMGTPARPRRAAGEQSRQQPGKHGQGQCRLRRQRACDAAGGGLARAVGRVGSARPCRSCRLSPAAVNAATVRCRWAAGARSRLPGEPDSSSTGGCGRDTAEALQPRLVGRLGREQHQRRVGRDDGRHAPPQGSRSRLRRRGAGRKAKLNGAGAWSGIEGRDPLEAGNPASCCVCATADMGRSARPSWTSSQKCVQLLSSKAGFVGKWRRCAAEPDGVTICWAHRNLSLLRMRAGRGSAPNWRAPW